LVRLRVIKSQPHFEYRANEPQPLLIHVEKLTMQHILVVDDDKKIVRLVRAYLEQAGFTVLTAYDGQTALQMIHRERPDLVVLDLMLPDLDGWEIIRQVRSETVLKTLPIITLTARIEDTDKIVGLELGADDYITKPFNPREVLARVRAVLRRSETPSASETLHYDKLTLDPDSRRVTVAGAAVDLTATEFELLKVLMNQPGRAFTRLELIEQGLGYEYLGPERSIDTHIKNLRKKIESTPDSPSYIQTVYGHGYRLGDGR
jgi:two-component system alkaline phosphatase synthesis response regulator PhoP